jgi:molybdate transport system ATP-binding protein
VVSPDLTGPPERGLDLVASVPERGLDVALAVPAGRTLALLGPNGSGKSTVLALLAGLLTPEAGRAVLNGRVLVDLAVGSAPRRPVVLPAHRRRVALLAQDPMLFPHLDVLDNVAFGPRSSGRSSRDAADAARWWLAAVGAGDLADRPARALSGGQAQRVALARALAAEPELLLLDEPLASLDVDVAGGVRQTLARALAGRTTVLVTHDVLDVALLADDVVVLDAGRIGEAGPARTVMRRPRTAFAGALFGLNLLAGRAVGPATLRTDEGWLLSGHADPPLQPGEAALAAFQPAAVSVHISRPSGSPRNVLAGRVTGLEPQGHLVRVRVGALRADITPAAVADLDLAVGDDLHLAVKAAELTLYAAPGRSTEAAASAS